MSYGFIIDIFCYRYWEACKKFDQALDLVPDDERLFEMKAQVSFCLVKLMKSISQGYVIWLTGSEFHATWNSLTLYFLAIVVLWHEQELHFSKYD